MPTNAIPAEALRELRDLLDAMLHDSAKYPQLNLPDMQLRRAERMCSILFTYPPASPEPAWTATNMGCQRCGEIAWRCSCASTEAAPGAGAVKCGTCGTEMELMWLCEHCGSQHAAPAADPPLVAALLALSAQWRTRAGWFECNGEPDRANLYYLCADDLDLLLREQKGTP